MIDKFFLPLLLVFAFSQPAMAQRLVRDCVLQPELIFNISKAEYGSYNVWDSEFGEMDTDERFTSAVALETGNVVGLSELSSLGKPEKKVQLAEFDNRGRLVWDVSHSIENLAATHKILRTSEGFTVLGTARDKNGRGSVWLGFFDKAGKLLSQKTVSAADKASLLPEDMIVQTSGSGFILSASTGNEKKGLLQGVIYRLDSKGKVIDHHGYLPGLDNRVIALSALGKDYYLGSGYLRGEDGRIGGWLLKLNKDGSLVWQRQYPRGASAQINRAVPMVKDYVLASGQVEPLDKGTEAAWVMMLDGNTGNMIWQRYYTDKMDQKGGDILVNMEGMASVMVQNSRPQGVEPSEETQDFVRLLTVNERGVLFMSDEYFNGTGFQGSQMIGGRAGERIITGRSDIVYKIEPKPGEPIETMKHGWDAILVAAAPMESHPDPCLALDAFSP